MKQLDIEDGLKKQDPYLYVEYSSGRTEKYTFKKNRDGKLPQKIKDMKIKLWALKTAVVVKIVG